MTVISCPDINDEKSSHITVVKRRCARKASKTESTKSRYFSDKKLQAKPPFILSGNVAKWTPPKSPYNLIQVCTNYPKGFLSFSNSIVYDQDLDTIFKTNYCLIKLYQKNFQTQR